jgi:hypothetical protein
MTRDTKAKAEQHATQSRLALENIARALAEGKAVALSDAKVLEAAGCWLRRNMTEQN